MTDRSEFRSPLAGIQRHLQAIYALELPHRIEDFVINDGQLGRMVEAGWVPADLGSTEEQVLVAEGGEEGELELAVYLSDAVQGALGSSTPTLQDHCHATEAASHFVMLLWSAQEGRRVRLLDLELQAEIDKATTALLLDWGLTGGAGARDLLRRLFHGEQLLSHLSAAERLRYKEAHRLARGYAQRLCRLLDSSVDELLAELRTVYRLPTEAKLHRVAQAA